MKTDALLLLLLSPLVFGEGPKLGVPDVTGDGTPNVGKSAGTEAGREEEEAVLNTADEDAGGEEEVSEETEADAVGAAPEPPAALESCANPTEGGLARYTEYTFF